MSLSPACPPLPTIAAPPRRTTCSPSSSTSSMMASSSSLVGVWPSILITVPSSLTLMSPPPSASNMSKAALNSGRGRGLRWAWPDCQPHTSSPTLPGHGTLPSTPPPAASPPTRAPALTSDHLLAEVGPGLRLLVRLQKTQNQRAEGAAPELILVLTPFSSTPFCQCPLVFQKNDSKPATPSACSYST